MALLRAEGLVKHYGATCVVNDVGFSVESGRVLGLLGPNGAGKTTTMRMLYGFLRPDSGIVEVNGRDFFADIDAGKRTMGVCTQDDTFDTDFTVADNLRMAASYFRPRIPNVEQRIEELLQRFELKSYERHKPDTLSGGYRRRLMIARALINSPSLLFLDEPTTGLDPQARRSLWKLIDELRRDGLGIVLTTHYMDEAEYLSDRLVVLQSGKVIADDKPSQVLGDLVGEHVVVIPQEGVSDDVHAWWNEGERTLPEAVLGEYHLPMSAAGLSDFAARFADADYEVRKPNLDDLFVHLSTEVT